MRDADGRCVSFVCVMPRVGMIGCELMHVNERGWVYNVYNVVQQVMGEIRASERLGSVGDNNQSE